MNETERKEINNKCPYDQGIFTEPYGIPDTEKRLVLYTRYITGGADGGNCWGDGAQYFYSDPPKDKWKVLDLYLKKFHPDISYLQYKDIDDLIHSNENTEWEYYGNYTEYTIEYIVVEELEELLK